ARKKRLALCDTPIVRSPPKTKGPMKPPRFPIELIRPIDAAAADAESETVGNTQKGGGQQEAAMPSSASQTITAAKGCPGIALSARKNPVAARATLACFFRS